MPLIVGQGSYYIVTFTLGFCSHMLNTDSASLNWKGKNSEHLQATVTADINLLFTGLTSSEYPSSKPLDFISVISTNVDKTITKN